MNPWRDLRALPREMWVLAAATLINRAGTMVLPFLVLYLTEHLHFPESKAGLVLSIYGIGSLVTSPLAGRFSDRLGPLRVMRLSLLLSGAVLFFFPLVHDYPAILCIAFFWAMLNEAFRPASMSVISDWVQPERRKAAFALSRLAINLGMSIGPAAGGFIASISFTALFFIDGATSVIAGAVLALFSLRAVIAKTSNPVPATPGGAAAVRSTSVFADRRFLYFLAALLPVIVVFFQHNSTLPLFIVRELQLPESDYGILFAINTVMIILMEVPLNTSMAHWPHRHAMGLACVLWGAGFGALMFATGMPSAAFTVAVWTFGEMILFPTAAAYVSDIAPTERRGMYMGIYQMTFSLGFILAPWMGTLIFERFGSSWLWGMTFALGCLSAAMMWRIESPATAWSRKRS
ncbi:MAG: MDR family MFS transporter [bacterium]